MRIACLLAVLEVAHASGAMTASITSVNQTQAVLQERGFSGSCLIQLSTSPGMTTLHPDVDPMKHSGASIDITRADTLTSADGATRIVTIGHQTDDRALANSTTYYYLITGCGATVTGTFTTATLSSGTTRTEQSPFNDARWGNLGLPPFDWTTKASYVDPMTGVTMQPMSIQNGSWRTGCGSAGCASSSLPFTDWNGGVGWSNPAGILSGARTNATTTNTNPLDLYPDISSDPLPLPYDWHRTLADIGVVVWGSSSSYSAADSTIDLCIILNPSQGCASNVIKVVLMSRSVSQVRSGSSDADGAFPAAFPQSPFFGWTSSPSPLIRMENRETYGMATVSGQTLTIGNLSTSQHFSSALAAGQKIYVSGSGCANNLCTVAAPPKSPGVLTLKETPWPGSVSFRAYGWGIRVWKDTAQGQVSVGLRYKLAGFGAPIGVQAGGDKCSSIAVKSGDGKTGYLCMLTSIIYGGGALAFVATDGTTRVISGLSAISFDDTRGNVFYSGQKNSNGGWSVYKYTYLGNYTTDLNSNYTCGPAGDCPPSTNGIVGPMDLMPHASNADLDQQIAAAQGVTLPAYNAPLYGRWTAANPAVGFYGTSGHFALFCNVYSGQGQTNAGGPGWCASVDLSQTPAKVVRLIHTLDGTGLPQARFGSLHTAGASDSYPNGAGLGLDELNTNKTSVLFGGPFQAPVMSILMANGAWNTNTCLDWPAGTGSVCGSQSYYRNCPALSAPFTECVTIRLPQNGVCNVAASAVERSNWPCPWNSNYSQYPLMQPGDNAADLAAIGGYDSEHFRVLSATPDVGNTLRVVFARNATYDYCSFSPWHGQLNPLSMQNPTQLRHANGWTLTMMPGYVNACGAAGFLLDQATGIAAEFGRSFTQHSALGVGASGQNFVTHERTMFNTPFNKLGQTPPIFNESGDPAFHGNGSNIGSDLQSYVDDSQRAAGTAGYPWALDMNPLVACTPEQLGCGPLRSLTPAGVYANVYKIHPIGSALPSAATYKTQPMIGWAGRYQLKDVSGPTSTIANSAPFSMCFALRAGECLAGSLANDVYVNVPSGYDPGYCSASISWANIPCVLIGDNAPAGGIRQFRIDTADNSGTGSRFVTNGWSSVGRHYPYTHATAYPNGQWAMLMGTNAIDGYYMTGFMIALPPWQLSSIPDNDFKTIPVSVGKGSGYAQVEFGYSRFIGPANSPSNALYCTPRADNCEAGSGAPFAFQSEGTASSSCSSGCNISIPAVGPNLIYYRVRRSTDGRTWSAGDIQAVAIP